MTIGEILPWGLCLLTALGGWVAASKNVTHALGNNDKAISLIREYTSRIAILEDMLAKVSKELAESKARK